MENTHDLTQGNILKTLIMFAIPYFISCAMQALYGAVDMLVVGKYSGTSALSAVNVGSQTMQIITSFILGCTMATTVLLGRYVGEKNHKGIQKTMTVSAYMYIVAAIVLTPAMLCLSSFLVNIFNTPKEAVSEAVTYIRICSLAIPFIILFNVVSGVLRGMGDSKTPMLIVGIACIINIALDFLLTGFLGMGVFGVAIATSLAQLFSSVVGILIMYRNNLRFKLDKTLFDTSILKNLLGIGLPIAMQDTLINMSFIIITVIANGRGLIASSAVGVVEKVITFMFLVPSAMLSATSAITAQNLGANKMDRARTSLYYSLALTVGFGVCMCVLSWIIPQSIVGIFTKDAKVIVSASEYLKTYSIDCILAAITFCLNGYLCGMGKSTITFIHNVIAIFTVRIPVAYFMTLWFPKTLLPMGLASPMGSLVSICILMIYFKFINKSKNPAY